MTITAPETFLPAGVRVRDMTVHQDERGSFTELFRDEWLVGMEPVQWNVVRSRAGVFRGVHVHILHDDYLIVTEGWATIGLRDFRRGSETEGRACTVELRGDAMQAITIPHGVAHGFLFRADSTHIYAVSRYWDMADEIACRYDDPELGIEWPVEPAMLSDRDRDAQPVSALLAQIEPHQPL